MLVRLLTLFVSFAPLALADVEFTSPAAGASVKGGSTISVEWKDSGSQPPLSDLQSYTLFLCAGGNDAPSFIQLAPISTNGEFSTGSSASGTVQANLGGSDTNAYFLKMISVGPSGTTVTNYSKRFSLSGMTGTFPSNVQAGIKKVSGTAGPPTEKQVQNQQGANAGGAAGPAGAYTVPYTMQTGSIKYAPMQGRPGTKITAASPTPQYPTSSVSLAKTFLPTPIQVTTMTMSQTYSVSSRANTAAPAPQPSNDMQKFLQRWKD